MVSLGLLVALGTIVESRYDANFAREQIYHRWWMFLLLILLVVNLTSVMAHRWPWKKRHLGFLLAHIGIILVLAGSLWTYLWGLDGSLYLPLKGKARYVSLPEKEITIYASFDGKAFSQILRKEISFPKMGIFSAIFSKKIPQNTELSPKEQKKSLRTFALGGHEVSILDYKPYTLEKRTFILNSQSNSPAVLFQMKSQRIQQNVSQWLWQKWTILPAYEDLGPAIVLLSLSPPQKQDWQKWVQRKEKPALWLFASSQETPEKSSSPPSSSPPLHYRIYSPTSPLPLRQGKLNVGKSLATGWMDLKFQLLRYLPQAKEKWSFVTAPGSLQGKAKAAIHIAFRGEKHWLPLNQSLKLFTNSVVYLFSFGQKRFDLGYELELKNFQVQYYPGTRQASEYQSHLKLQNNKEVFISMNQPWKYKKITFYQASFEKDKQGRPLASILSVNYDPGRWWKYLGCAIVVLGILVMFYTKRKKTFRLKTKSSFKVSSLSFLLFLFLGLSFSGRALGSYPPFAKAIGGLPLQEGGRIKPFDSFARESLMQIYGKQSYGGRPAHEVIFTWLLNPTLWRSKPMIRISHKQLKTDMGFALKKKFFSIEDLERNPQLPLLLQNLQTRKDQGYKLKGYDRALSRLQSQMGRLAQIMNGQLSFLPIKDKADWLPLSHFNESQKESFSILTKSFLEIVQIYIKREKEESLKTKASLKEGSQVESIKQKLLQAEHKLTEDVKQFRAMARKIRPSHYPSEIKIHLELHYNRFRPFFWATLFYFLSLCVGILSSLWKGWQTTTSPRVVKAQVLAILFCVGGFFIHTYGFFLRSYLAERAPVSNIYETLVWVAWGALLFAFILSYLRRFLLVLYAGTGVAILCLLVSSMAPTILDASIQPLEAVLRSNFWLFFHVLTITISYSAFFIAFILSELGLFSYFFKDKPFWILYRERLLSVLYRCLQIGIGFLATGIILGGIWADYSWGRFWGWDPKETWAFITLLGYIVILHGRLAGWLRDFGMFMASSFAFFLVLMSWYGVNFILGTGLHSYGFGFGGAAYVFSFVGLHFLYALGVTLRHSLKTKEL